MFNSNLPDDVPCGWAPPLLTATFQMPEAALSLVSMGSDHSHDTFTRLGAVEGRACDVLEGKVRGGGHLMDSALHTKLHEG